MQQKIQQLIFDFEIITFELLAFNTRFYRETILFISVNKLINSLKISDTTKTEFSELISFQSDQKMTKILPCRLKQSFGPLNMLTHHNCSDKRLFTHLSNHAFYSL